MILKDFLKTFNKETFFHLTDGAGKTELWYGSIKDFIQDKNYSELLLTQKITEKVNILENKTDNRTYLEITIIYKNRR